MVDMITIAAFPAINRPSYLSKVNRDKSDLPDILETTQVVWEGEMSVEFADGSETPEATVKVAPGISLALLTKRLERLLAFGVADAPGEWVLKYSDFVAELGGYEACVDCLCDKIVSSKPQEKLTIGVLKLKRRSVKHGHANVKIDGKRGVVSFIIRHANAQGLCSLWKSIFLRLDPQFGDYAVEEAPEEKTSSNGAGLFVDANVVKPCIRVSGQKDRSEINEKIKFLSESGQSVDLSGDRIDYRIDYAPFKGQELGYNTGVFYASVKLSVIPSNMPEGLEYNSDFGGVVVEYRHWKYFAPRAKALSQWLSLGWAIEKEIDSTDVPAGEVTGSSSSSRLRRGGRKRRRRTT